MSDNNLYLKKVIDLLRKKKDLAYTEFKNTDLNTNEQYDKITEWFSDIENRVEKNPPTNIVKVLTIFEDIHKNIVRVEYEYFCEEDTECEPSICLVTELY